MEHRRNRFLLLFSMVIALLVGGCAAGSPPPPQAPHNSLVRYQENSDVTFRLDVVSRGGHGSGTVISTEGHILTAAHVAVAGQLSVLMWETGVGNGKPVTYPAALIGIDHRLDLAVVKIERHFETTGRIGNMANVHPGDEVYNVGYPYDFGEMVARGHVMRLHYSVAEDPYDKSPPEEKMVIEDTVLTDFLAGPGTSGSGVFLARSGELVGVMRLLVSQGFSVATLMVTRGFVPVSQVEPFLRKHRVPYIHADGRVQAYVPLPPPMKEPPSAKPADKGPVITPLPIAPSAPKPAASGEKPQPSHPAKQHKKNGPRFERAF